MATLDDLTISFTVDPGKAERQLGDLVSTFKTIAHKLESEPRDWYFTFGAEHRAHAVRSSATDLKNEVGNGFCLHDRYVVINDTYWNARTRMAYFFGQIWSGQYATAEAAGVHEYGLTELVLTELSITKR